MGEVKKFGVRKEKSKVGAALGLEIGEEVGVGEGKVIRIGV